MKRYFSLEDFITFIYLLEENKPTKLFTESLEDGSIKSYTFMRMQFAGENIILYRHYTGAIGIIQDTPAVSWEDFAEGVYEDLTMSDEYKVFIESK